MKSTDDTIQLTCECGAEFYRTKAFIEFNEKHPNVFWRWKLKYCNECYKKNFEKALDKMPEVLTNLSWGK